MHSFRRSGLSALLTSNCCSRCDKVGPEHLVTHSFIHSIESTLIFLLETIELSIKPKLYVILTEEVMTYRDDKQIIINNSSSSFNRIITLPLPGMRLYIH